MGWIRLDRKIFDNWVWKDKPYSKGQAWIDLLLQANYSDEKVPFNNGFELVQRGSFITSIRKLSIRWGWSKDKVSRFLNALQIDEMLIKNSDTNRTLVTIVNYGIYQDGQDTNKDSERTLTRTAVGTTKEYNNNNTIHLSMDPNFQRLIKKAKLEHGLSNIGGCHE